MKRIITLIIITLIFILAGLTACSTLTNQVKVETSATEISQANMPNPASVYCTQNGNKNEIRTADDGSQTGVCIFPDGSICDDWAYFKGECGQVTQIIPTPDPVVVATIYPDAGNTGGNNGSGGYMPPGTSEVISDWTGVIGSTEPGAQFNDYFELQTNGQKIYFGIDSMDPAVKSQIEGLRDSGKVVHLYGILISNVPDYNGSQVQVERIEVEE